MKNLKIIIRMEIINIKFLYIIKKMVDFHSTNSKENNLFFEKNDIFFFNYLFFFSIWIVMSNIKYSQINRILQWEINRFLRISVVVVCSAVWVGCEKWEVWNGENVLEEWGDE